MPPWPIGGVLKGLRRHSVRSVWGLPRRALSLIAREGWSAPWRRLDAFVTGRSYRIWIARYDTLTDRRRQTIRDVIAGWPTRPLISVVTSAADGNPDWLRAAIRSVEAQLYPHWELCIGGDVSTSRDIRDELARASQRNPNIRVVFDDRALSSAGRCNAALALATGPFVALFDAHDQLAQTALYQVANEIVEHPDADLIFSDEDSFDERDRRRAPQFKADWNPALMLSQDGFHRLGVYRRALIDRAGGFREGFEGAHDHDLVLRCAGATEPARIRHIPRILYHRRATPAASHADPGIREAHRRAVEAHLAGSGATAATTPCGIQVAYPVPDPQPRISILVPTTARPELLHACARSVLERSTYRNFELLLMVNDSHRTMPERKALLDELAAHPQVRVLTHPDRPFNFSWVNNWAAAQASGTVLCLLNDDTEVITPDWLEKLVSRVMLDGVGAAGPLLIRRDGTIQHAGVILGLKGVALNACTQEPRGSPGYFGRAALEQDVSCVTAGCMMIRREVFDAVGRFDERFAVAFNDVDLCLRVRAAGWRILFTPAVELYHDESASVGPADSSDRAEAFSRERALMRTLWGPQLDADPFYNPNLSLTYPFAFASPPRLKV